MAFLKCVVSFFFLHSDTASLERFRTRIPSELCSENLYKFTNALKEYCGMKEACAKHCISDFELKMFGISKQSKESYALYTQLQWTTEREAILSDLEGNELNGKKMISVDIDIEDLFTVEYYKPFNISSVALFLRQTYVKQQIITEHAT